MKYLITGGAGFIGSNLCDFLVKKGHLVSVVDDLSTGYLKNLKDSIDKINFYNEKIEQFNFKSITDFDAVIHLAAQPSVPLSVFDFGRSSSSNLLGTVNVVEYCRVNRTPLIFASSSAVYGNLALGNDRNSEIDLLSPYATDKYVMELYAKIACELYQLSSVGLRFFNVYGPRQDPSSPYSGVISIFADKMLKGEDIIINGGQQTRDFIYVNDVVDVIYRAIKLASEKTVNEVSNVLTGKSVTIDNLADQMMGIVGTKIKKEYLGLPIGDPEQSSGTIQKMETLFDIDLLSLLGLNDGLVETIKFIRND